MIAIQKPECQIKSQCDGIRQGEGYGDQVFELNKLCEKFLAICIDLHVEFMNLRKSFHKIMWHMLQVYGVGWIYAERDEKSICKNSHACVVKEEGGNISLKKMVLLQKCMMSP